MDWEKHWNELFYPILKVNPLLGLNDLLDVKHPTAILILQVYANHMRIYAFFLPRIPIQHPKLSLLTWSENPLIGSVSSIDNLLYIQFGPCIVWDTT